MAQDHHAERDVYGQLRRQPVRIKVSAEFANPAGISLLTFTVQGATLNAYVNGTLEVSVSDDTLTSGSVGICGTAGVAIGAFQTSKLP